MRRSVVARLQDMLAMIDAAAELIDGSDFAAYRSDLKLRLAIERCIEVVSEASRHVPAEQKVFAVGSTAAKAGGIRSSGPYRSPHAETDAASSPSPGAPADLHQRRGHRPAA